MSATTAWVGTCPRQPHVKTVSTKENMNKGPSGKCCDFSHEVNACNQYLTSFRLVGRGFASRLSCLGVQSAKRASVQAKDCVNTKLRRRTSRFFEKGFTKSGWIDRIRSN